MAERPPLPQAEGPGDGAGTGLAGGQRAKKPRRQRGDRSASGFVPLSIATFSLQHAKNGGYRDAPRLGITHLVVSLSPELLQECLGLLEVRGLEPLGKPAIHLC
jgi:hypothetical protein